MSSSGNLAQMFAQSQLHSSQSNGLAASSNLDAHSKAIHAEDDQHFKDTSFQLKRTRSVGLLDEFIVPTRKLIEQDQVAQQSTNLTLDDDYNDDDNGQFIENVADVPKPLKRTSPVLYTYDDNNEDNTTPNDPNDTTTTTTSTKNNDMNDENSPSPSGSPDLHQPHDDNDIVYEPSRHVDYLSHNWKESDISKSWRYIVLKRKDVANSARLENASWRTWAQAKYNLKTISPESVNWLKDSDVTWLYGPLYKEPDHGTGSTYFDLDKQYGSDTESSSVNIPKVKKLKQPSLGKGLKPILKKRTVSEMLSQPSNKVATHHHNNTTTNVTSNTKNLPSPPIFEDDFDLISRKVNSQYSNTNLTKIEHQPLEPLVSSEHETINSPKPRHIHFNDRVEQCIALNYPESDGEYDAEDEDYDDLNDDSTDDNDSDSDDEEGGFFLMVKSPSSAQLHNKELQSLSSKDISEDRFDSNSQTIESDQSLTRTNSKYQTIELLPATTLKYGSDEEIDNFAMSHNTNTSRGYDYHYDYNSVFKSNENTVHIGSNDFEYEDTPEHLEGVNLVDVPENIVLGSNVEIVETPQFLENSIIAPSTASTQSGESFKTSSSSSSISNSRKAFSFHSDSESDSEDDSLQIGPGSGIGRVNSPLSSNSSVKNYSEGLRKASPSPSSASLSEVAAHGYISQGSNVNNNLSNVILGINNSGNNSKTDVTEIQKNIGELNIEGDSIDKGFRSSFLNSWKKHT